MSGSLAIEIVALIWLSAVCSGSEIALYSLSRIKLRWRERQGHQRAVIIAKLLEPLAPTVIAILIANNIVNEMLAGRFERLFSGFGPVMSVMLTVLVLTPAVLIFGEFLPKHLFRQHADRVAYEIAWFLRCLRWLLYPAIAVLRIFAAMIERLLAGRSDDAWEPHTSRPNLRTFLADDSAGHDLSTVQRRLIDRALVLERFDLRYDGVTRPLRSVAAVDAAATIAAARHGLGNTLYRHWLVTDHHHGRPIGVVSAIDLVCADDSSTVGSLVKPLPSLPAATPLHQALQAMHDADAEMALVPDAPSGPAVAFRSDLLRVLTRME